MQETLIPQEDQDEGIDHPEQPTAQVEEELTPQYYGEFEEQLESAYDQENQAIVGVSTRIDQLHAHLAEGFKEGIYNQLPTAGEHAAIREFLQYPTDELDKLNKEKEGLVAKQEKLIDQRETLRTIPESRERNQQLQTISFTLRRYHDEIYLVSNLINAIKQANQDHDTGPSNHGVATATGQSESIINFYELAQQQQEYKKTKRLRKRRKREGELAKKLAKIGAQKVVLMRKLHDDLKKIDQMIVPDIITELPNCKTIYWQTEDQSLYILEGDSKKTITIGDIIADSDYGTLYQADINMPKPIWRKLTKIILIEAIKKQLEHYHNLELKIEYSPIYGAIGGSIAHRMIILFEKKFRADQLSNFETGFITEMVVQGLLLRLSYNNPALGVRIEAVNVLEDEALKYDLKIVARKIRGIALEKDDESRETRIELKKVIGLQLTSGKIRKKKVDKVKLGKTRLSDIHQKFPRGRIADEIIIVKICFDNLIDLTKQWFQEGKPSGGIEQYLTQEQKKEIITKCLSGLVEFDIDQLVI